MQEIAKAYDGSYTHSQIMEVDERICRWIAASPPHLRYSSTEESPRPIHWAQKQVLASRFLNMRILLHRPCVSQTNYKDVDITAFGSALPALSARLVALRSSICVQSAIRQIEHISECYKHNINSAWWYDLTYIFSSAIVLLAQASTCRTDEQLSRAITLAFEVIRQIDQGGKALASDYLKMLERFQKHVSSKTLAVYAAAGQVAGPFPTPVFLQHGDNMSQGEVFLPSPESYGPDEGLYGWQTGVGQSMFGNDYIGGLLLGYQT